MSVGGVEFGRAMARQLAEAREKMADKRARSRERWEGKRGADQIPTEALACPACREEYAFGYDCPSCNEPLVSAGLVDVGVAPPAKRQWWKLALALSLFFGPYLAWVWFFGWSGGGW